MNRRAFLASGALAGLSAAAAPGPACAQPALAVVYIGGWDCGPCLRWRNTYRADWLASPEYRQVQWIEIEPPRLKEAYQARFWPDELKPILERLPLKNGTPRFLVVRDGRVLDNQFGGNYWPVILADIRKYIG
jgi:hypothetical protein